MIEERFKGKLLSNTMSCTLLRKLEESYESYEKYNEKYIDVASLLIVPDSTCELQLLNGETFPT